MLGPESISPFRRFVERDGGEKSLRITNVGGWACAQQAGCLTQTWVEILSHTCDPVRSYVKIFFISELSRSRTVVCVLR